MAMLAKPITEAVEIPKKPYWLNQTESQIWDYILPKFIDAGHLTKNDGELLGRYCATMHNYILAKEARDTYGLVIDTGKIVKCNPAVHAMAEQGRDLDHILAQFGMTPTSRAALSGDTNSGDIEVLQQIINDFRDAE
jgi:P27 family predicted phage terminase small subunit